MATWNFHNQVVTITGGTGGLGIALAKEFLKAGAKVYLSGANDHKLQTAHNELMHLFAEHRFQLKTVDVKNVVEIQGWLKGILAAEQRIDVLVNAAGVCDTVHASKVDEELWDHIMDVNLKGTFFTTQIVAEAMKTQGYGRIINISSISANNGGTLVTPPYSASKAGVVALTKSFACIYSPFGVNVNAVSPGPIDTDMISGFTEDGLKGMISKTPNGRIAQPEDVVQSILFLSDASSKHISGATIDINGGLYMR